MPLTLPTFLPLTDAARKYNLPEKVLTQLIQAGKIEAAKLPSGEILVSDQDLDQGKTKEQIVEEKFGHLKGQEISIYAAAKKYRLPHTTLQGWIRAGHISIMAQQVGSRSRTLIDESEAAYCAFPIATIPMPRGSPALKSGEKKSTLPTRPMITPTICSRVGISLSQKMLMTSTNRGERLIIKEPVVAGRYFNPQKSAPFPRVSQLSTGESRYGFLSIASRQLPLCRQLRCLSPVDDM